MPSTWTVIVDAIDNPSILSIGQQKDTLTSYNFRYEADARKMIHGLLKYGGAGLAEVRSSGEPLAWEWNLDGVRVSIVENDL